MKYYFFLASIKLLTNVIIAITDVKIIKETLKTPRFLPSSIADINGFVALPKIAIKVITTAKCAIILLLFLTPLLHNNNITPKNSGMKVCN